MGRCLSLGSGLGRDRGLILSHNRDWTGIESGQAQDWGLNRIRSRIRGRDLSLCRCMDGHGGGLAEVQGKCYDAD